MILYMADSTLCERLTSLGFVPDEKVSVRKQIRLQERGTIYIMELRPEMKCLAYKVDGNIIKGTQTEKCDYLVLVTHDNLWGEVFVELKGSNISHAVKQVIATLNNPLFKTSVHSLRRARIVTANRIPSNTGISVVERAKADLRKLGCEFRVVKSMQPDILKLKK